MAVFLSFSSRLVGRTTEMHQSPELEYRHELMGRLHKLDTDVELEIIHNHSHGSATATATNTAPSHGLPAGLSCGGYTNGLIYDSYGKEYYFGE